MQRSEKIIVGVGIVVEIIAVVLIVAMLSSCRSPQKVVSASKQSVETSINNDVTASSESRLKELTDQVAQMFFNEYLNVHIENIKYDTTKPVDSISGKHPVAEETKINVQKETKAAETDSTHRETESVSAAETKDNSQAAVKVSVETKEEKQAGLKGWQKLLIDVGGLAIVGFIIFITYKIKK